MDDPFNEIESGQILIGVANIFLTCLLQDASLCYSVPIINQLGQVWELERSSFMSYVV